MQLHSSNTVLQTNAGNRIKAFKIEATAKSFAILSSSLYSDKISAIIRELSCNALDSHVDAKNPDPFIIHLPTTLEPYFYVEDFGTGMSQEMIENLYSTYFSSTKTLRDDQIGALGLGSKSPFAYTDMFTIDSVYNGIQYTYSAAINETGIPSLVFLNKKEVPGKHTGVKIQFAVNPSDFESFAEKAVYTLWRFTPRPKVIGGSNTYERLMFRFEKDMQIKLQGKDWAFYNSFPRWSDTARVLMGNILYDIRSLASDPMFEKYGAFLDSAFVFEMPLGSCDITPSRETLSFDDLTKKNIAIRLGQIADEISLMLKDQTNDAATIWIAALNAKEFYSKLYSRSRTGENKSFYYKNVLHTLGESVTLKEPALACYFSYSRSYSRQNFSDPAMTSTLTLGEKYLIVETLKDAADAWKNSILKSRVKLYFEGLRTSSSTTVLFVREAPETLCPGGNPPSVKVQDLPRPKRAASKAGENPTFEAIYGVSGAYSYRDLLDNSNLSKIAYMVSYKKRLYWSATPGKNLKGEGITYDYARTCFHRGLSTWISLENQDFVVIIPYMTWKRLSKTAEFKKKFFPVKELVENTVQEKVVANLPELSKRYCARILIGYYDVLVKKFELSKEYAKLPADSAFKVSMEDLKKLIATSRNPSGNLERVYKFYTEMANIDFIENRPLLSSEDPYKFFERYPFLSVFFNNNYYCRNYSEETLRTSPFENSQEKPKISILEEVYRYINMVEGRVIAE